MALMDNGQHAAQEQSWSKNRTLEQTAPANQHPAKCEHGEGHVACCQEPWRQGNETWVQIPALLLISREA